MVQIIQSGPSSATLRQQALDSAFQNIASAADTYQKKDSEKAATLRQQALADQTTKLKLVELGIANPDAALDQLKGKYNPTETSPAQEAVPAQVEQKQVAGPVRPGEKLGFTERVIKQAQDAVPAQYEKAPLQTYTVAKQAEIDRTNAKKIADEKLAAASYDNKIADTQKKQEETTFIRKTKPLIADSQIELRDSQINRNEKYIPGGTKAPAKAMEDFRKAFDPSVASSRSPIGKEYSKYQQSTHALNLLHGVTDLNQVSGMKKRELAVTLATMLSPGLPHESTISHLDEPTLNSYIAEKIQAITGEPAGTNSAGLVKQLLDSVKSQREVSKKAVKDYQDTVKGSFAQQISSNPDGFEGIMKTSRIERDDKPAVVPPAPGTDQAFEAWKKAKGHK